MSKPFVSFFGVLLLFCAAPLVQAQQKQYPVADMLADKIIAKYKSSSCVELKAKKMAGQSGQKEEREERVVEILRKDPAMREHFLNRIAGPVVNKMFECGMIP